MGRPDPVTIGRFRLFQFDALDSTQIEAEKEIYHNDDIIVAVTQKGAYGRRGRSWQAPPGNLYVTIVKDYTGSDQLEYLPYAAGLALYDAVAPFITDIEKLWLKWPNDVLIDGKKLSGILIEIRDQRVLVGVGVNVVLTPDTDQPVTCVNDHAMPPVGTADVLKNFLTAFDHWVERAEQGGFAAIREEWLERAAFKGDIIHARLANGQVLTGIFENIDKHGALVLRDEKAHHVITSADIFFGNAESGNVKTSNE